MEGITQYKSKDVVIAPFLMLYFNEPQNCKPEEVEVDINSLTFFKSHEDMFDGKVMNPSQVRQLMLNPQDDESAFEKFMMVDDDGVCYPGHVPLLEDLFGYSEVFITVIKNQIEDLEKKGSEVIIPPTIHQVIDPKPRLEVDAPVFAIGNLPIRMSFASYTDAFQVNQLFSNLQVANITVFHSVIQEQRSNGVTKRRSRRYHDVRIEPEYFHKYCRKPIPLRSGNRIVSWNVRGVSRPSFYENFEKICAKYNPVVVILVETRISENNMAWVMSRLSNTWGHVMFGDFGATGGPVVFIYDKLQVKVMDFLYTDDPWIASVRVQGLPRTEYQKQLLLASSRNSWLEYYCLWLFDVEYYC